MWRSLKNSPVLFPSKYTNESYWGVNGWCVRLTTLPPSMSRLSGEYVGTSTSLNPSWPVTGVALLFFRFLLYSSFRGTENHQRLQQSAWIFLPRHLNCSVFRILRFIIKHIFKYFKLVSHECTTSREAGIAAG
jgi:hypothetical protein